MVKGFALLFWPVTAVVLALQTELLDINPTGLLFLAATGGLAIWALNRMVDKLIEYKLQSDVAKDNQLKAVLELVKSLTEGVIKQNEILGKALKLELERDKDGI